MYMCVYIYIYVCGRNIDVLCEGSLACLLACRLLAAWVAAGGWGGGGGGGSGVLKYRNRYICVYLDRRTQETSYSQCTEEGLLHIGLNTQFTE